MSKVVSASFHLLSDYTGHFMILNTNSALPAAWTHVDPVSVFLPRSQAFLRGHGIVIPAYPLRG